MGLVGQHYTPLGLRLTRQLFLVFDQDGDDRLSAEELHMLNLATSEPGEELDDEMIQELLLLFDSDDAGMTFAGFLDLYRMPDMDIAHDCYVQRLSHGRNITDMPTHLHQVSGLPEFHQA